jgi:cyclic pyranopterin phosphate synthase
MPERGVELAPNDKLLTRTELIKLLKIFTNAGVDKVRLTGGEPTIRKDLTEIIKDIRSIPQIKCVAMTTNGIILKPKLKYLKEAGLDNINISLDTLVEAKFTFITRRMGFKKVLEVKNSYLINSQ